MQFVATQGGSKVPGDTNVKATVGIGPRAEGGFGLEVGLAVYLPGLARADAEALVQKPIRSAPTRTQRVTASTCAWTSLKLNEVSSGGVQTPESIDDQPKQRRKS
jgi:hypothetical protein